MNVVLLPDPLAVLGDESRAQPKQPRPVAHAARPPEPVKALAMPWEDDGSATHAGDSAPPSFRPDGTTGATELGTAGNATATSLVLNSVKSQPLS